MNKLTYKELLNKSLTQLVLICVIMSAISAIINFIINLMFQFNSYLMLPNLSKQTISNFLGFFIWLLVMLCLRSKKENSESFLSSLFTILLVMHVYVFIKSIIINVFYHLSFAGFTGSALIDFITWQFNNFVYSFIVIVFLIILIRNRNYSTARSKLVLFRNISIVLFVIHSIVIIFNFTRMITNLQLINEDLLDYIAINDLTNIIFYLFRSIIWLLFIINFVNYYERYEVSMTIQDNENIINFDNSLKNAFGQYGVVIILLITSIINLGIYVSDIINEFKIRLSLTYINGILNSIITDLLIFELLIIFCITILVFKRNKSSLLTPLIGYGLNQLAIILYNVNNLINVFIVVKETHFQVNQLLSFILIC
ncbi:MAG TPA: hypothetical protein VIK84_03670 [Haloplasmataceae bacterium]